jgi:long-chain fatty acid transport protein
MRKFIIAVLAIVGMLSLSAPPVLAGAIVNKSNLSADYFRSLTRHASVDAADIIAYNPAGVMALENGLYVKADLLYITKDYDNKVPTVAGVGESGDFNSDEPSIVPGLFAVYKRNKWAGFFAVTIPGGGGEVDYEDGNARTAALSLAYITANPVFLATPPIQAMTIEANSFAIGYTIGGAYEINPMFSLSGGVRYIDAHQKFKGEVTFTPQSYRVDIERDATGWGYFLGVNITPTSKLNLGLLYQSNTELDYKNEVKEDTSPQPGSPFYALNIPNAVGWPDGSKEREDLPGFIGLGLGYQFTPKIRGEAAYTRYLESNAKWEGIRFSGKEGDSWEVAVSCTYTFNPKWRASVGYMYTDIEDIEPENMLPEAPELDARTIGIGAVYSPIPRLDITFGFTDVTYDAVTAATTNSRVVAGTELDKHSTAFTLGAQYRF